MSTVLITGISGGLAQVTARQLLSQGHRVVGVDYRSISPARKKLPAGVELFQAAYNKTAIEDVFRRVRPEAVLHLGRVGNLAEDVEKRFELNVIGSQKLMNLCLTHGVKCLVVLSTFHIYGASPRNHTPISEEDPLRAGTEFPQLADAIQLDNMAFAWVYRHPEVRTVVLRPVHIVGPQLNNTMSRVLRLPAAPYIIGFNPMVQFIHQDDAAEAIIAAMKGNTAGMFNVAGAAVLPWKSALRLAGARPVPWAATLSRMAMRVLSNFPGYLVNFLKYPCVIGDAAFRREFNWEPKRNIAETLHSGREHHSG